MNHGSLFSGIGGFDLAAQWMGWTNVFHCECEKFPRKILNYHFPKSISYGDITKTDFTIYRGHIDVLTGGFPCQPYSTAGKRLGKEDERHLWPEMLRAIREIQPRWVVGENVRGIINWNGGLVFEEVQTDLEAERYEVQSFILPAAGVNAPHRRERVWFVARKADVTNSDKKGLEHSGVSRQICQKERIPKKQRSSSGISFKAVCNGLQSQWTHFPTESPIRRGDDGIPKGLDGITFSKWRKGTIQAYGNAIVPQVVYPIYKAIQQYESKN
jgi:DNA (cytosine-5)-methyltransferase 1